MLYACYCCGGGVADASNSWVGAFADALGDFVSTFTRRRGFKRGLSACVAGIHRCQS